MHQPGPPRFVAVGEDVELAPREPDPGASYEWRLADAPAASDVELGDDPVEHLVPDEPGVYRLELDAPDGTHVQRVRAFPDVRGTARFEADAEQLPDHDPSEVYVVGPWNEWVVGDDRPDRRGDAYVFERPLPPGEHDAVFLVGEDFENGVRKQVTVDGPRRPRVRLDARVDGSGDDAEVAFAADPRPAPGSDATPADLDVEFYVDDRDRDLPLDVDGHEARCSLADVDGTVRVHAVAAGERHSVADAVAVGEDGTVERLNEPPAWVEGATMYEIFVRSFAGDAGTTFDRLADRVPYLDDLGVDVVWLTPVLEALSPVLGDETPGGPHGYDIIDYFSTAPDLGTREEFEAFVDACHDAGIRVVFDLVINHTSADHPFHQLSAAGVEPYRDWYEWTDADEAVVPDDVREEHAGEVEAVPRHYFNWWSLPNLNYDALGVRDHVLDVVSEWADVVDGFRCDVAWGVPHGVWKEVRDRVRAVDDDFFLLDETVPRDPDFGEGEFDAHYDTTLYHALRDVGTGDAPADEILDAVRAREREGFPPDSVQMRYVENHDEDRYLDECGRDELRAAAAATFTLPGLPMIYYGQESGMTEYRGQMNWTNGDGDLRRFHRRLVAIRDETPALVDGDVAPVDVTVEEGAADRVVAYARESGDDRVVVVLHFGAGEATVTLPEATAETDLLTGTDVADAGDGETAVTVDAAAVVRSATGE
ncbi:alpha-amylase family glycosyl hydrolase [Halomicrobium salinisoli]|uniref:alpha-amylase family glycosyl hydrolase n=1 Tax=Halomicrobium salinisoli TaxID=2878391 RepID=UPI001CEFEE0C|nr:alpha-amylase family glycosyl hydrolase [Halomicrobium salinisoli]